MSIITKRAISHINSLIDAYGFSLTIAIVVLCLSIFAFPNTIKIQFDAKGLGGCKIIGLDAQIHKVLSGSLRRDKAISYGLKNGLARYWSVLSWGRLQQVESLTLQVARTNEPEIRNFKISVGNIEIANKSEISASNLIVRVYGSEIENSISNTNPNNYLVLNNVSTLVSRYIVIFRSLWLVALCVFLGLIFRYRDSLERHCELFYDFVRNLSLWISPSIFLDIAFASLVLTGGLAAFAQFQDLESLSHRELSIIFAAELIIMTYFASKKYQLKQTIVGGYACLPALYLSVERITHFLTTDEPRAISVIYRFPYGTLRHWLFSESRLSYVINGTFSRLYAQNSRHHVLDWLFNCDFDYRQVFKAMHMLVGLIMLFVIIDLTLFHIIKLRSSTNVQVMSIVFFFTMILCLPVLQLGLKNYNNYDLYSMLVSVIGMQILYIGIAKCNRKALWLSYSLELLACYEKPNALPLLIVSGSFLIFFSVSNSKHKIHSLVRTCLTSILLAWVIAGAIQFYVINVLGLNRTQIYPITQIFSLIGELSMSAVGVLAVAFNISMAQLPSSLGFIVSYAILFGSMLSGGLLLFVCDKSHIFKKVKSYNLFKYSTLTLVLLFLLSGAIVTNYICLPCQDFSRPQLFLQIVCHLSNALPSCFVIILLINLLLVHHSRRLSPLLFISLPCFFYFTSISLAIMRPSKLLDATIATTSRYLNMYILSFVVFSLAIFVWNLNHILPRHFTKKTVGMVVLTVYLFGVSEIFHSSPAYCLFFPFWNTTTSNDLFCTPTNWGEQGIISGEAIYRYCLQNRIDIKTVKIFHSYNESWIANNHGIRQIQPRLWAEPGFTKAGLSGSDFYVFDNIYKQSILKIPDDNINPILVLKYRNRIVSRIYTGDQLKFFFSTLDMQHESTTENNPLPPK